MAEERSFTQAARRLHLTQQSLSAAISSMERQLGCRLLARTSRRVELTAAGAALLEHAPAVLGAVDVALTAMRGAADELYGELRVRYGADSEGIAEPALAAFQQHHPRVKLQAWSGMDSDNLAALNAGEVDSVLAWATVPARLSSCVIGHEQVLLAIPDRHPLARLSAIPVEKLAAEPLVMFPREGAPAVWDLLVRSLHGQRAERDTSIVQLAVSGQASMVACVLRGQGVCPVSASLAATLARPGIVLRPLDAPVRVPLHLAWRGRPNALVQALADDLPTLVAASADPSPAVS